MADVVDPTIDQIRVFLAVVDEGSFSGAARRLNRATSAISYAISNLENQLGQALFDRTSTRLPRLTDAGQAVLSDARTVTFGVDGLKAKARGLIAGVEAEVSLAVDVMLPNCELIIALRAFEQAFPSVSLRLHIEALGGVTQHVLDGVADLGISGPHFAAIDGLDRIAVGSVALIPVAAPSHPLARQGPIAPGEARDHVQLVLSDRSRLTEGRDFSVVGLRTWRMADLGAKHDLLLGGIGWGNMPAPVVEADIEAGRLVRLHLPEWSEGIYDFHAIYRTDAPPRPAAKWLINQFATQLAKAD